MIYNIMYLILYCSVFCIDHQHTNYYNINFPVLQPMISQNLWKQTMNGSAPEPVFMKDIWQAGSLRGIWERWLLLPPSKKPE